MRVAVVGATGRIGALTVDALGREGHEAVRISRSLGVDVTDPESLDRVMHGVDAVIDVTNSTSTDQDEVVGFFTTATRNLLAAEHRSGVGHHVLLSIAGLANVPGNAHYAGKRAQESLVSAAEVPWTIVPATQFHDFAAMVTGWAECDGSAHIAPLLLQPIAPKDVADILVEIATGPARGRYRDIAGPQTEALVDMARRTYATRGQQIRLIPTWSGMFGTAMAGNVLLPREDARLGPTSFEAWLAEGAE